MYGLKNTFNRILGLLVCVSIISVMFFAVYYTEAEVHHICTGEDCPICAEMDMLQNAVRQIGAGIIYIVAVVVMFIVTVEIMASMHVDICISTPVSNKVRLND